MIGKRVVLVLHLFGCKWSGESCQGRLNFCVLEKLKEMGKFTKFYVLNYLGPVYLDQSV